MMTTTDRNAPTNVEADGAMELVTLDLGVFESANPKRRAAPAEVKEAAVRAVARLLAETTMSVDVVCDGVAKQIGFHRNSVKRWCHDAGVERETVANRIRRDAQVEVEVYRALNRELTEQHMGR